MKLNQLFLLHSSCCSFHGSTCVSLMAVAFWRLCHSAIEKQAFLCLPGRSAATLVACLDIDVIYLIFDMQFSRCSAEPKFRLEMRGFEPLTPCLQGRCSPNGATPPKGFRQPPALPCRLQHSTIGRLGLNHRVRDGNGCDPQAHRHRNFFVVP